MLVGSSLPSSHLTIWCPCDSLRSTYRHWWFKEEGIFGNASFRSGDVSKENESEDESFEDETESAEKVRHV